MEHNQSKMLSVEKLNEVLGKLQNNGEEKLFETYTEVDIVFIAGLFLYYKKKIKENPNNWTKINTETLRIRGIDNSEWKHQHYFKQIEELYNVKYDKIFDNFPLATSVNANSFSYSFTPILYINDKTLNAFFSSQKIESGSISFSESDDATKIIDLKNKYLEHFIKKKSEGIQNEINYLSSEKSIIKDLEQASPMQVFVYTVVYNKIEPLKGREKKGQEKDAAEKLARQLWLFTQEYCEGLYELAKNIVEHSSKIKEEGKTNEDGEGIITIRSYNGNNNNEEKIKVLETHVFDYGEES